MKIAMLGIGGVGGYFGGLLAKQYSGSKEVEIIFIARGSMAKVIIEKGLTLITPGKEQIIKPDLVSSDPEVIGKVDILIIATKGYDLIESITPLKACISKDTLILPLLNGVDAKEKIEAVYSDAEVVDGCTYLVSQVLEPGVVKAEGEVHSLFFGSESVSKEKLKRVKKVFIEAGIECYLSETIEQTIWEKFIFISSIASLTSYYNFPIGKILEDKALERVLLELVREAKSVADAKGIKLSEDIIIKTLNKMKRLPFETTSSMQRDFEKGRRTEYQSLTEYVSFMGKRLKVKTPTFDKLTEEFKKREKGFTGIAHNKLN